MAAKKKSIELLLLITLPERGGSVSERHFLYRKHTQAECVYKGQEKRDLPRRNRGLVDVQKGNGRKWYTLMGVERPGSKLLMDMFQYFLESKQPLPKDNEVL